MNEKIEKTKQNVVEFARKAKDEAKQAGSNVVRFAVDNKELLLASIPVVVAIARTGQSVMVNRRVRNERKRIQHTYYDPSTGMHWDLKRKASNADRAEILRRKADGQDTYTILRQMNLIR